jgi:hypothetical protein
MKKLVIYVALLIAIYVIVSLLSGCSIVRYEARPDGTTIVSGYVLGTDKALDNMDFMTDGKERSLHLNGFSENQTAGMEQMNKFVQSIVEGAVKGAK